MDNLLISKDDIKIYRPTAELDNSRIEPYIRDAQALDLQPVLNPALYLDFCNNYTTDSKYIDLLNGKQYTKNGQTLLFEGVKPMLVFYTLARFVAENPLHITRFGIVRKTANQSEAASPEEIRMAINILKSNAGQYQTQVIKYLEDNVATYTLYNYDKSNNASITTGGLKFFKA